MAPHQYTFHIVKQFQQLFDQRRYTEAAALAVNSPQISDTLVTIQSIPVVTGQSRPLWQLYKKLSSVGKLDAFESLELARLVVSQNKKNLLESWLAEDKLECSEELGDLVKILDNNLAHNIYAKARENPRPVSTSAERGGVEEIFLYANQVNPGRNAPWVVGKLLDAECPEDFIKSLILAVRSLIPVEPLVQECEKRNHLHLLTQFLEHLASEGSQDVHVHNALCKIIIDNNNNPEHFLTTNPYYDSRCVGKYCEKNNPNLALVVYSRGKCVDELINFTNTNHLFKLQAIYVVETMDSHFWEKVLDPANEFRRQLIDEVVSMAVALFKDTLAVSVAIKAFITADLPHDLLKLLEKIVFQTSAFSGNSNLQNLLILTSLKVDTLRVMDYINRLYNYDGRTIGEVAVEAGLYEEAFVAFKKFNLNVQAVNVLLHNIHSIERAAEFAFHIKEDTVWSQTVDNGLTLKAYVNSQATSNQVAGFTGQTSEPIDENYGRIELYTEKKGMDEVERAISNIIGMDDLKLQLRNWAKVMLLNEKRRALGHNLGARKLPHMAFLGNPGTGKTMVARILGKLLHTVGILPSDRVTEVQRTDLVGEYIGQTGPKTRAKINEAEGGILFVDEAYRLAPPQGKGGHQDFGLEALEEIMSVMDSGKIVVIFAGYEKQMKSVIASNEGFQRRVTKFFNFANYNPMDLAQIVRVKMTKQSMDSPFYGFKLDPLCNVEAIRKVIDRETTEELRNKMNGGLAELMLVNALEKLDLRLDIDTVDSDKLVTITMEDLENGVRSLVK